ncbi:MAG TPA: hypothetical protein ENK66_03835 [Arcobacter sp.]|nr:hypothetical protein [Arcobacter sp.]
MGVNRYKEHLVVFLEDQPYRDILNGVQLEHDMNIDVKKPCGGWNKVFNDFERSQDVLEKFPNAYVLLLMDFDDKQVGSQTSFEKRKIKFNDIVNERYKDRVFLLGTNYKESEDLKKIFQISKFEEIGQRLVKDCPHSKLDSWKNTHLECNLEELSRMKDRGVFNWLFGS